MKCLVAGATGLVGTALIRQLVANPQVDSVTALVRNSLSLSHEKLIPVPVVFDKLFETTIGNFELAFCCLGTTIKKAGSQAEFKKVDHDFVLQFADLAKRSGVRKFLVVTALGANTHSMIFYNRVKGEVEEDLRRLGFESLLIFRPSLLLGERKEPRLLEQAAVRFYPLYRKLFVGPLARQTPVHAEDVAKSMIEMAFEKTAPHKVVMNHEILGIHP